MSDVVSVYSQSQDGNVCERCEKKVMVSVGTQTTGHDTAIAKENGFVMGKMRDSRKQARYNRRFNKCLDKLENNEPLSKADLEFFVAEKRRVDERQYEAETSFHTIVANPKRFKVPKAVAMNDFKTGKSLGGGSSVSNQVFKAARMESSVSERDEEVDVRLNGIDPEVSDLFLFHAFMIILAY